MARRPRPTGNPGSASATHGSKIEGRFSIAFVLLPLVQHTKSSPVDWNRKNTFIEKNTGVFSLYSFYKTKTWIKLMFHFVTPKICMLRILNGVKMVHSRSEKMKTSLAAFV